MDRTTDPLKPKRPLWQAVLRWRHSIRAHAVTYLLLTALAPLAIIFSLLLSARGLLLSNVQERQQELTRLTASQIESMLSKTQSQLASVGALALRYSPTPSLVMDDLVKQNKGFRAVYLFNADGEMIGYAAHGSARIVPDAEDWTSREAYFRPRRGEVYYSGVRLDGTPRLQMGLPIRANGAVQGVIIADVDLSEPLAIIRRERIGHTGYAALLDQHGNLIVGRDDDPIGMSALASPAVRAQRSDNPLPVTYSYRSPFSQEMVLGSAQRLPGLGWIVLTERPMAEAMVVIDALQNNALLAFGLALGLVGLATLSLTQRVLPPVRDLIRTAERIHQGDEHILTRVYREDELGVLAQAFNRMTERQRAIIHELGQARHKAEESARLKSQFISTMSHELRTPLNAIEGFTSLMLEGEDYELSPRARTALERVSTNSKHLLSLINDLLDFSKLEAGGYRPSWYPCAPSELGQIWQAQMSGLAERKGLALKLVIDPQMPGVLISDMDALNRIGLNLLSNAIKFTERGEVDLRLARDGEDWLIVVRDTGIGISPEAQSYVFDEFRQADGSLTRRYGGTGLGLAIVRRLVTMLGGRVSVTSTPGEGSTFTVRLPIQPPGAPDEVHL